MTLVIGFTDSQLKSLAFLQHIFTRIILRFQFFQLGHVVVEDLLLLFLGKHVAYCDFFCHDGQLLLQLVGLADSLPGIVFHSRADRQH